MSLVVAYDVMEAEAADRLVDWFDSVAFGEVSDHRKMLEIERAVDANIEHINSTPYFDPALWAGPLVRLADHRLELRLGGIDSILAAKWRSAPVRRSLLAALERMHEKVLAARGASTCEVCRRDDDVVVFSVGQNLLSPDLCAAVFSFQLSRLVRWQADSPDERSLHSALVVPVRAPRWVYDLFSGLRDGLPHSGSPEWVEPSGAGSSPVGPLLDDDRWYPLGNPRVRWVGRCAEDVDDDVLDAALTLWCPEDASGEFYDLADAIAAARLLG